MYLKLLTPPVSLKRRLIWSVVKQFHNPRGMSGHVVGWIMAHRSSNVQRSLWAVELMDVQPDDKVMELGCGPGLAVAALAKRADRGLVVGVDHSDVMIRHARRRNATAVESGRVDLVCASVERLDVEGGPFDAVLSVNSVGFWPEPADRLAEIRRLMRPGGRIALVSQPRCPGADATTSAAARRELVSLLSAAGYEVIRCEQLNLDPPVVCVLAVSNLS